MTDKQVIPDKCLDCSHAITTFEDVHKGWCKYELEYVIRCDCAPQKYVVGCVCAELYCRGRKDADSRN